MRNPIRIQSVNTKYFIISTKEDKPGQKVVAKPGSGDNPPENSVRAPTFTLAFSNFDQIVFSDVVIVDGANVAVIVGVSGLYIALKVSLLDLTSPLRNNCGLTGAGVREMPNLFGPTSLRTLRG